MECKTFKFEIKQVDEEEGVFEGYASTFTQTPDSYGEIVDKGAFKKTIKENRNRIKTLWNHNIREPIGKPLEMKEDEKGLWVKIKLTLGVQRAKEILALMKDEVINEMSIGFDTITEKMVDGIRHLKEVKLYDVSPVSFAANPEALITAVKGMITTETTANELKEILTHIQALLETPEVEEPEEPTPETPETKEAAELEGVLNSLEAAVDGFDERKAEAALEEALSKIK